MSDQAANFPSSWRKTQLQELVTFQTGRTPARANAMYWDANVEDGTPWVSIRDMKPFGTISSTAERITQKAVREVFKNRVARRGTLLMSFKLTIGRVATLGVDACHNEAIISIRPNNRVNQKYLEYFLSQVDYADYQDRAVKGNTLNQEKIDRIEIAEPPKSEQEKIAAVLWKAQTAIEVEERLLASIRELKRTLTHRLFTVGLNSSPSKETELGLLPEEWRISTIGETSRIESGGTPSKSVPEFWNGQIPWVSPKDMKRPRLHDVIDHISTEALNDGSKLAQKGSVLVVVRGMILAKEVPVALLEQPMAFNQDIKALTPGSELTPEFLLHALSAYRGQLFQRVEISGHGTRTLTGAAIADFQIPIPPIEEQREIARILDLIDHKMDVHQRKRYALRELFDSLRRSLMTAEIRVADLEIDVRDVVSR